MKKYDKEYKFVIDIQNIWINNLIIIKLVKVNTIKSFWAWYWKNRFM